MKVLLCRIEAPFNLKCAGERLCSGERGRGTRNTRQNNSTEVAVSP